MKEKSHFFFFFHNSTKTRWVLTRSHLLLLLVVVVGRDEKVISHMGTCVPNWRQTTLTGRSLSGLVRTPRAHEDLPTPYGSHRRDVHPSPGTLGTITCSSIYPWEVNFYPVRSTEPDYLRLGSNENFSWRLRFPSIETMWERSCERTVRQKREQNDLFVSAWVPGVLRRLSYVEKFDPNCANVTAGVHSLRVGTVDEKSKFW